MDTQFAHPAPYSNHLAKHFDMWLYVSCTMLNPPAPLPRENKVSTSKKFDLDGNSDLVKEEASNGSNSFIASGILAR
jgi:hypothetical protein